MTPGESHAEQKGSPDAALSRIDAGFTDLGSGSIDFRRLFRAVEHWRATYIVERDNQPHPRRTAGIGLTATYATCAP